MWLNEGVAEVQTTAIDEEDLKRRVTKYIETPYGMIGLIVPPQPPTEAELRAYHKKLAEISVRSLMKKTSS